MDKKLFEVSVILCPEGAIWITQPGDMGEEDDVIVIAPEQAATVAAWINKAAAEAVTKGLMADVST